MSEIGACENVQRSCKGGGSWRTTTSEIVAIGCPTSSSARRFGSIVNSRPGMLESAYEACLMFELIDQGLRLERQKRLPIVYRGHRLDCGYRVDMIVEDGIVIEVKAIERLEAGAQSGAAVVSQAVEAQGSDS